MKLLVLGGGLLQLDIIKKAKVMGLFTIVADQNPNALGFSIADKSLVIDITNKEVVLKYAENEAVDGVIHPCSEVAAQSMGYVNDRLGLSGISYETSILATNKEKMREAFTLNNAPSPFSKGANNLNDTLKMALDIDGDVIIKPSRNSGSRGVTHLTLKNKNFFSIKEAYNRAINNSYDNSVVVESYIVGPEFSVEIIVWNNVPKVIAVTDKLTTGSPFFVELGHSQPTCYSDEIVSVICNAAILGCRALKLNNCCAHCEIKLQSGKPYIIEIGARLGGDFISTKLAFFSTGIDMVSAAINISLGIEPDISPRHSPQGCAIRYFTPKSGLLKRLVVNNEVKNLPYVIDFVLYKNEGDIIPNLMSSVDRSGHIITTGKTANEAVINAEKILDSIFYETASDSNLKL